MPSNVELAPEELAILDGGGGGLAPETLEARRRTWQHFLAFVKDSLGGGVMMTDEKLFEDFKSGIITKERLFTEWKK